MIVYTDTVDERLLRKLQTKEDVDSLLKSVRENYPANKKVDSNQLVMFSILMTKLKILLPLALKEKLQLIPNVYGSHKIITYRQLKGYI